MTVWSSPSLGSAGGKAILTVGNYDHTVYALDAATGETLWKFTTGGPVYSTPVWARQGDRPLLFVTSTDRLLYAIDPELGRQVWVHAVENYRPTLGGARLAAPCVGGAGQADDTVFVAFWVWDRSLANSMQRAGLMALSTADGKPLWRRELGDNELTAPVFVREGGRSLLYVGSANGNVYALDARSGDLIWQKTELDAVRSPPAFVPQPSGSLVIMGSKYGNLRALDALTGVERWVHRTGDRITGAPAVRLDPSPRVFVGSYDRGLRALDGSTGSELWRYSARGGFYASPALVPSVPPLVLDAAWDHVLHVVGQGRGEPQFSAFTGRPLWNVAGMDDSTWSSPAAARIAGHWLAFVGSYDGTLRALPLDLADRAAPELRSNLTFWLSFPALLGPVVALAWGLTRRSRRRALIAR
jgi:outer membrane protein assembly factor BamB